MKDDVRLCVTTSQRATADRRTYAKIRSGQWDAEYVDRNDRQLRSLIEDFDAVLVFEDSRIRLVDRHSDVVFHPGLAYRRIERLVAGSGDPLVDVGGIRPGHRVLDGTLGLGQDALVAAVGVGGTGQVIGLEASRVLSTFAAEGLPGCRLPACANAGVITVHHAETGPWLAGTTQVFDVAVLDPMFIRPKRAQHSLDVVRRHARSEPLDDALIDIVLEHAETVVVKVGDHASLAGLRRSPNRIRTTRSVLWAAFTRS